MNISFSQAVNAVLNPPSHLDQNHLKEWVFYVAILPSSDVGAFLKTHEKSVYDYSIGLQSLVKSLLTEMPNENLKKLNHIINKNIKHFYGHYQESDSIPMCVYAGVSRWKYPGPKLYTKKDCTLAEKIIDITSSDYRSEYIFSIFDQLERNVQLTIIQSLLMYTSSLGYMLLTHLSDTQSLYYSDIERLQIHHYTLSLNVIIRKEDVAIFNKDCIAGKGCGFYTILKDKTLLPDIVVNSISESLIARTIGQARNESEMVPFYFLAKEQKLKHLKDTIEGRLKTSKNMDVLRAVWPWFTKLENGGTLTEEDLSDRSLIVYFLKKLNGPLIQSMKLLGMNITTKTLIEEHQKQSGASMHEIELILDSIE